MTSKSFFDWQEHFKKKVEKRENGKDFKSIFKIWRSKNLNINKILIFDIDGCICSNNFPNLTERADIEDLKHKILETNLYLEFINFYNLIAENPRIKIIFITGRRAKDFKAETLKQLEILEIQKNQIIFFPDCYNHTTIRYNTFKVFHILRIARKYSVDIHVFDDMNNYFLKLLDYAERLDLKRIFVYPVKDAEFWIKINQSKW